MTLPVYNITATVEDSDGQPVEGALVVARLTINDYDTALDISVAKETYTEETDANGEAVLSLWPNVRGANGSQYRVKAYILTGDDKGKVFDYLATVQEQDDNLTDILTDPPSSLTGMATVVNNATEKTTFADTDRIAGTDSEAAGILTWWTWANIKSALSTTLTFLQSGTGAVSRTVQSKLREEVSLIDIGGTGDGVANEVTPITNLFAHTTRNLSIPPGTYLLNSDVTPSASDVSIKIDPSAVFSGAGHLLFDSLINYQITPVWAQDFVRKTFDSTYSTYSNIFLRAAYAKVTDATPNTVAVFGAGEAAANGANSWGGNFIGSVSVSGGTAIAVEINPEIVNSATGTAYGVVVASAGEQAIENALQIQANNANCQFTNGVRFVFDATNGGVTGSLLYSNGASGASCQRFIYFSGLSATSAEVDLPSFAVGASVASTTGRILVTASSSGNPSLGVTGSATNINLFLKPKGSGTIQVVDSSSNVIANFAAGGVTVNQSIVLATGKRIDYQNSQTTVGAAGGASSLPATPTGYFPVLVAGSPFIVPYYAVS